jgi:23S rRNA pseudouridine2605 synthase
VKAPKRFGVARIISKMGYCSRSKAAALILEGRVSVNGRVVRDPELPVQIPQDRVEVDGSALESAPLVYLAMNKPHGVVTTASDEKGRATVYDLLESEESGEALPWVAPVGRLDKASEGLLLLTNDSEWAARITDPRSHLDKTYHVQVDCLAQPDLLAKIAQGCRVDGERLRAKRARLLRHGGKNSWLEIVLDEGKNRQIRRLLDALGIQVLRLIRVSVGPLELGDLKKGAVRRLRAEEKQTLDQALARAASQLSRGLSRRENQEKE